MWKRDLGTSGLWLVHLLPLWSLPPGLLTAHSDASTLPLQVAVCRRKKEGDYQVQRHRLGYYFPHLDLRKLQWSPLPGSSSVLPWVQRGNKPHWSDTASDRARHCPWLVPRGQSETSSSFVEATFSCVLGFHALPSLGDSRVRNCHCTKSTSCINVRSPPPVTPHLPALDSTARLRGSVSPALAVSSFLSPCFIPWDYLYQDFQENPFLIYYVSSERWETVQEGNESVINDSTTSFGTWELAWSNFQKAWVQESH